MSTDEQYTIYGRSVTEQKSLGRELAALNIKLSNFAKQLKDAEAASHSRSNGMALIWSSSLCDQPDHSR